ncbi:MAG: beta-ketoacyl synthase N-terminal-like domain-containing protein [Micropruina sp.]|uniref:polyketide synthase n=1 Tax=Micropruina sp. TaxID=2737536 RepID=UPI0039E43E24
MTDRSAVAVTGLAVRLPGADTPEQFWRILVDGIDKTAVVSRRRRELAFAPDWSDVIGEVADIDRFDADFFGIDHDEATFMDPQHRITMEIAHDALGDAGLLEAEVTTPRRYGVYVAMSTNAYYPMVCRHLDRTGDHGVHQRTIMNSINSALAARISHQYNLTGPAMAVDTACSSFLTALTQGIEAIRHQGCDGAVVAGVNLLSAAYSTMLCNCAGITTHHPFTRVFDEHADGTLIGEGAIVCVLEREDIARRKNRRILARIRGYSINNDGSSLNVMAPNPRGQADVIRDCYAGADGQGVDHTRIGYIETHGTGTRIGDPIELNALGQVYHRQDFGDAKVGIGSVKTNIGHLLSAAGGAGLAKLVLSLQHATMVPSLHLETINPLLEMDETPFEVVTRPRPWPKPADGPRMGAITSLGLGGTNVHVVVEEGDAARRGPDLAPSLLCVSAKTGPALDRLLDDVAGVLAEPGADPFSIAMTLARFRTPYPHRAVVRLAPDGRSFARLTTAVVERPVKRVLLPATADARTDELTGRLQGLLLGRVRRSDDPPQRGELAVALDPASVPAGAPLIVDPQLCDYELASVLFLRGCRLNWQAVFPDLAGTIVALPPYPFDRTPHWLNP